MLELDQSFGDGVEHILPAQRLARQRIGCVAHCGRVDVYDSTREQRLDRVRLGAVQNLEHRQADIGVDEPLLAFVQRHRVGLRAIASRQAERRCQECQRA